MASKKELTELLGSSSLFEASAAINGLVARGLKGELCLSTALAAGCVEILSCGTVCVLLSIAASLASLGLVGITLLCIESLLACGKYELVTALYANESLVNVFYCCCFFGFGTFDLDFFVVHVLPREICDNCPSADSHRHLCCYNALFKLFEHMDREIRTRAREACA